ncbi:two-component system phosphate regulon sensor histidine kinase PhoR [Melaminivora alkalimesophila]|uniref:Phosphate regulon sensor protein PhoR n=2 Tax=Melaminivora alkalimesophila TaxID=1165852 RepID=A0A317RKP4_9BURK|nr:phosphate regulon sensor histidine kinase PhoR [Melaminivora alkalimesophila]PWW49030.1 two-component system phosphate regulon sensor histidine kinase PhoR [Melaminivora alkalimesophila]
MSLRLLGLGASQLAAGALGGWLAGAWGAAAGVLLAPWPWLAWEGLCARRLLAWLRAGAEPARAPRLGGAWGEAADRTRRLLRQGRRRERAAEARVAAILAALQASPNGVVLLDAQGRIEWCNQVAQEHFGIHAERDALQALGNLVREPAFHDYCHGGDLAAGVLLAGRASTPARPVRLSVHLHPYGDGRHLLLSRDVTQLEQAEAMRRDFVANVSHEIRTPLTVLIGLVEALQDLPLAPDEQARYLGLMSQQGARMQRLVEGLLSLSRLEGSAPPGLQEWVCMAELLGRCREEAQALSEVLAPGQGHRIVFSDDGAPGAAGWVAGSASELHSALSNLIGNALRYTPAGGLIEVAWRHRAGGGAVLTVSDTGPGIPAEHLPRITERFYRVDGSRARGTGGTGLGLAIVRHVVQRHGAHLQIDSPLGEGARFAIEFPPERVRQDAPQAPPTPPAPPPGAAA